MAKIPVVSASGKGEVGKTELDPALFETEVKPHLFHAEVRRQLAARRAGTHATRNRAAVAGGGSKPWRQKGTGRARHGSTRAAQWAGGGVVFGPVPRSYRHKLSKKVRSQALCSALSLRRSESALVVADALSLDEFATRRVLEMLDALGIGDATALMVLARASLHFEKSAGNLPGISVLRAEGLNVYDVLRHDKLVIEKDALPALGARLLVREEASA